MLKTLELFLHPRSQIDQIRGFFTVKLLNVVSGFVLQEPFYLFSYCSVLKLVLIVSAAEMTGRLINITQSSITYEKFGLPVLIYFPIFCTNMVKIKVLV